VHVRLQLRIQNRSHFINEQTSEQFQRTCGSVCALTEDETTRDVRDMLVDDFWLCTGLGAWLDTHKFELYDMLRPGRDILFGTRDNDNLCSTPDSGVISSRVPFVQQESGCTQGTASTTRDYPTTSSRSIFLTPTQVRRIRARSVCK
jgi:hypothetical protein